MTTTTTAQRHATAGQLGGALWALLPAVFVTVPMDSSPRGTLTFAAVAVAYWIVGALSLLLLLAAMARLRTALAGGGRLATAGIVLSGIALLAMLLGNGTELATLTFTGAESDLGHSVFLVGFLVLIVGSLLLGIALLRGRRPAGVRWAGALMVGMVPLGMGLGLLLNVVSPQTDLGFWAAITVPYGVAWVLLGRSLGAPQQTSIAQPSRVS